jgi:tetratricopeptide (TPR) repeat protein
MNAAQQDFQSLVLSCNKDGMEALRKGQHKAAFEQFKYAEAILIANQSEGDTTSLQAVTCNNLGCYYKKAGKFHGALSYLRRALKMELELKTHEVTLAGTHLNICAILSKLEKHDKAVQHALSALELINQLVNRTDPDKITHDDYSVLAIAYHNVAVERDFLKQYEKAASAFQQGYQVAKRCFGEDHPLSVTLGTNCDAVLKKAQKLSKIASVTGVRASMKDQIGLPDINTARGSRSNEPIDWAMPRNSPVHKEAAQWVSEEQAWREFAQSAVNDSSLARADKRYTPEELGYPALSQSPPPRSETPLRDAELRTIVTPSFKDTINYRDGKPSDTTLTPSERMQSHKTPLELAMDTYPSAMMDLIESESSTHALGSARTAPNDYRPNRVIKGSTRTARVVRRTGVFNSSTHRDKILTCPRQSKGSQQKSEYHQKMAAEKIQKAWRAWWTYCQDNSEWMTATWICATMIQARWRSYHVRRLKFDKAACTIQRHARGLLIRKTMRHHRAAVVIQRRVVGILTREQLRCMYKAAVKMQSLVRGAQARKRVREKRSCLTKTALTIQCALRQFFARRKVQTRRKEAMKKREKMKAAVDIQRVFRGWRGRKRVVVRRQEYGEDLERHKAATKLQAMIRRDHASKRVDEIRTDRLTTMNNAATFLRKMWLGAKTRKRYKGLVDEFRCHEQHIVTIQRYGRGFLVRLRMWREAIRAEEELWASLEIQRVYRGYKGRVRWEAAYECVYDREIAAMKIQRLIRGWLARIRVTRVRRKVARSEFERARRRFRAAQRIQAAARGMLARKRVSARMHRVIGAAVCIQRIARGHALRIRLWSQVIELRATMLTAVARGFLVRNRRFHLVAKVIHIQRFIRKWQKKPKEFRAEQVENMRERKVQAAKIQEAFRKHNEKKEIDKIQKE